MTDRDREWARKLAIHLGVESFSFDEAADIIIAALAERDAERPTVVGDSPVCLDCNQAGIRNCSHRISARSVLDALALLREKRRANGD